MYFLYYLNKLYSSKELADCYVFIVNRCIFEFPVKLHVNIFFLAFLNGRKCARFRVQSRFHTFHTLRLMDFQDLHLDLIYSLWLKMYFL